MSVADSEKKVADKEDQVKKLHATTKYWQSRFAEGLIMKLSNNFEVSFLMCKKSMSFIAS